MQNFYVINRGLKLNLILNFVTLTKITLWLFDFSSHIRDPLIDFGNDTNTLLNQYIRAYRVVIAFDLFLVRCPVASYRRNFTHTGKYFFSSPRACLLIRLTFWKMFLTKCTKYRVWVKNNILFYTITNHKALLTLNFVFHIFKICNLTLI